MTADSPPLQNPMESETLQCMEVWGGNQTASRQVRLSGLEAWVWARPYGGSAGGDVHYVSSCGTGRIVRILVADVSGHGEEVSETSAALRNLMRRHVNTLEQNRFVRSLNKEFRKLVDRGQFATAIAATFFAPTADIELTNAGHPRPLVRRASEGIWRYIEGTPTPPKVVANLPLGIIKESKYVSSQIHLDPGDMLMLYSDAVTEAQNPSGDMLDEEGLLQLLARITSSKPSQILPELLKKLEAWRGAPSDDDETIMILVADGGEPDSSFGERLRAGGRLAGGILQAVKTGGPFPWPDLTPANLGGAIIPSLSRRWAKRKKN
ncbi:MAG: serine/threonine-protein phosphatase [Candidatus Eisenbacteria bacterium]|uniref:Serine/threonine-protein phosphatase n=1 Tax=Eiseniibacteriota bacterium TaxID=2212470 RepID=A0A7Y2EE29_UNCEI|nr:serine/threonine-protein phosphatase [Candidatus Eisenbacteria bacterium]